MTSSVDANTWEFRVFIQATFGKSAVKSFDGEVVFMQAQKVNFLVSCGILGPRRSGGLVDRVWS